jgi:hypothetical protein
MMRRNRAAKWIVFGAICAAAVAITVAVALRASRRTDVAGPLAPPAPVVVDAGAVDLSKQRSILFRSTELGAGYGRVAAVPWATPTAARIVTPIECERIDYAAGSGVCLSADRGVFTTYHAIVFDDRFQPRYTIPLNGPPSRVRVAPDGKIAGVTVFVTGHSYAAGSFSTQTMLIDLQTGTTITELETFEVLRDGRPFKAVDFNFWGVTFAPDVNRFYATLGTGGTQYLVEGNMRARRATVIRPGVECPALSPDGRRVAFKKRTIEGGALIWRLALLDLTTMTERVLNGETRSVDDQVEWADDRHILYGLPDTDVPGRTSIWMIDIEAGAARRVIEHGWSPSVYP